MAGSEPSGADPFPSFSEQDWLDVVEVALKGGPFDRLKSTTADGIEIKPLYQRGAMPALGGNRSGGMAWRSFSRCDHPVPGKANRQALEDLAGGAAGLSLVPKGSPHGFGYGIDIENPEILTTVLEGITTDWIGLRLEPSPSGRRTSRNLAANLVSGAEDPATFAVSFGLDPIGMLAACGDMAVEWPEVAARLARTIGEFQKQGFSKYFCEADGRIYHGAGASEAQELSAVLGTAIAYLRACDDNGLDAACIAPSIGVSLAADADQFATIAKIRAMRRLWSSLTAHCGLPDIPLRIHAETAWRMMSRRDPHVNTLRTTVATFAAGIGGADSVSVLPFTQALGLPDGFARRLARNCQTILMEEANLHRVADPGAGSGYLQTLTDQLAEKAWSLFQELEKQGGIVAALRTGALQAQIAETRSRRQADVANRRHQITGTSAFANLAEGVFETEIAGPYNRSPKSDAAVRIDPLPAPRDAEPFEALRDKSDEYAERTGRRPSVFLAGLGTPGQSSGRAAWSRNFFEAGGIETLTNENGDSQADLVDGFSASGAKIACLCSSDDVYDDRAAEAITVLRQAGAVGLYLAGRPKRFAGDPGAAGLDGLVHEGCPAIEILNGIYAKIDETGH